MQREDQSKLNKLIQELCPKGVEYRTLLDVTKVTYGYPADSRLFTEDNQYIPLIRIRDVMHGYSETYYKGDFPEAYLVHKNDILVGMDGEFNLNRWNDRDALLNQRVLKIESLSEKVLLNGFIYHLLAPVFKKIEKTIQGSTVKHLSAKIISGIEIPVPPLPVQSEIVRILDAFTALTAELTAELTARRKQYEYYRDRLLKFDDLAGGVRWKNLDELCEISAGGDVPKEDFSLVKTPEKTVPIISNGVGENSLYGYTSTYKINVPAVTIAARGTIGYAEYRDYPYFPIVRLLSLVPRDNICLDTKYLYYCLQNRKYNIPTSGIPQLTAPMLKKEAIPLPPLSEQRRIVSILDRFDALCNDLTQGLPAEIAARRKQYEFYRDRLLGFQRKE